MAMVWPPPGSTLDQTPRTRIINGALDTFASRSQALPGNALLARLCLADSTTREAEPPGQCVPRQSLGTRGIINGALDAFTPGT
jgi:hypothetical protein